VRWAVALVQAGRQPSRKLCAGREQLPEGIIHGRFLFLSSVFATWPLVRLLASFSYSRASLPPFMFILSSILSAVHLVLSCPPSISFYLVHLVGGLHTSSAGAASRQHRRHAHSCAAARRGSGTLVAERHSNAGARPSAKGSADL